MSVFLRKGSPYYYAEFEIQGLRFLRSTRKTVEREALVEERRLKVLLRKKIEEDGANLAAPWTLSQCFGEYWDKVAKPDKQKLSKTWGKEVKRYSTIILSTVNKDTPIDQVSDLTVEEFVEAYDSGPYGVNRALAVWRRVHNLAKKRWKQKTQVIDWAEFINREEKRVASLEPHEAIALIKASTDELAWAIEWSLNTGTRWFETYGLLWDRINVAAGFAKVIAKGGKEHTVWLSAATLDLLSRIPRRGRFVFDRTNWRRQWDAARNKIGKPSLRWHDLRHTHATWLRQVAPLEVVQRSMGHAELATTGRYAHVADPELLAALQRLPSIVTVTPNIVPFPKTKSAG